MIVEPRVLAGVTCDVFCRVVDNFGDAGVCWRLSRQLARETGLRVRLVIDRIATLAAIEPRVDADAMHQTLDGVDLVAWTTSARLTPAMVVIEAFACLLPDGYRAGMAGRTRCWIDLEYLSAEPWVEGCHGLPSLQGTVPKFMFFPGFTERTGGLIVEADYARDQAAFLADATAMRALRQTIGLPPKPQPRPVMFAFCYPTQAIDATAAALGAQVAVVSPIREIAARFDTPPLAFVAQTAFDRVLWSVDLAIVRGEDSFVRAQLAGLPFVWHVYPQDDDAHLAKLEAFAQRYLASAPPKAARAWHALNLAWNTAQVSARHWHDFLAQRDDLSAHARAWADRLLGKRTLLDRLVPFIASKLQ